MITKKPLNLIFIGTLLASSYGFANKPIWEAASNSKCDEVQRMLDEDHTIDFGYRCDSNDEQCLGELIRRNCPDLDLSKASSALTDSGSSGRETPTNSSSEGSSEKDPDSVAEELAIWTNSQSTAAKAKRVRAFFNYLFDSGILAKEDRDAAEELVKFFEFVGVSEREGSRKMELLGKVGQPKLALDKMLSVLSGGTQGFDPSFVLPEKRLHLILMVTKALNMLVDVADSFEADFKTGKTDSFTQFLGVKGILNLPLWAGKKGFFFTQLLVNAYNKHGDALIFRTSDELRDLERALNFYIVVSAYDVNGNAVLTLQKYRFAFTTLRQCKKDANSKAAAKHESGKDCIICFENVLGGLSFEKGELCGSCFSTCVMEAIDDRVSQNRLIKWIPEDADGPTFKVGDFDLSKLLCEEFESMVAKGVLTPVTLTSMLKKQTMQIVRLSRVDGDLPILGSCSVSMCGKPFVVSGEEAICLLCEKSSRVKHLSSGSDDEVTQALEDVVACVGCGALMMRDGGCKYIECKTCKIPYHAPSKKVWTKEYAEEIGETHNNLISQADLDRKLSQLAKKKKKSAARAKK